MFRRQKPGPAASAPLLQAEVLADEPRDPSETLDETITFETQSSQPAAKRTWLSALPSRPRLRLRPWVWWTLGGAALSVGGAAASWLLLPVKEVLITGEHQHLSDADIKRLAGLSYRQGWLFYGKQQARGLLSEPWIQSATVTRKFPDTVNIALIERQPFLKTVRPSGEIEAVSADGKLLPSAKNIEALPSISGWGPERLADSVIVARALSRYTVQSVAYTPTGLTVTTASGTVWSGDLKSLVKYAGSISMYPNQNINIYPWGVSVQQ